MISHSMCVSSVLILELLYVIMLKHTWTVHVAKIWSCCISREFLSEQLDFSQCVSVLVVLCEGRDGNAYFWSCCFLPPRLSLQHFAHCK